MFDINIVIIAHVINANDLDIRNILEYTLHKVRANKASSTSHKHCFILENNIIFNHKPWEVT